MSDFDLWSEDVTFARNELDTIYIKHSINPDRVDQVNREVLFSDLVFDLTGKSGSEVNCPFHGKDSTPSFYVYPPSRGNSGWCFGCPPGHQYWDHVRFVRELLGYNFPKALAYIEKTYDLPFIADVTEDEPDDNGEITVTVEFEDLTEPYILLARREILTNKDIEQAEEFLRIYFQAEQLNTDANALLKGKEIEDAEERHNEVVRLKTKAAIKLASVLGRDVVDAVARAK